MEQAAQGPFAATRTGEQTGQSGRKRDTEMRDGVGKTEREKAYKGEFCSGLFSRPSYTHPGLWIQWDPCTFLKAKAAF